MNFTPNQETLCGLEIASASSSETHSSDSIGKVPAIPKVELQPTSVETWANKYQLRDSHGRPVDKSVQDTYRRVAKALASVEKKEDRKVWEEEFYWALNNGATPAGRILSNAGATKHKPATSLINCTVSQTVKDQMDGILNSVHKAGLTLKAGCGIGYEFSTLRPRNSFVGGAGASTSGPLSFMNIFDSMCFTVSSAGGRRGAQMGTFAVWHPDVEDFIKVKRENGRLRQFNLSLLIDDDFMEAVKQDADYQLVFPVKQRELDEGLVHTSECTYKRRFWEKSYCEEENYILDSATDTILCKVYRTVKAKALWDTIMKSTYDFSEPGFLLIDHINDYNNNYFCEEIRATNPCWTGDTLVSTVNGPKSFKELAEARKSVEVFCMDPKTKRTLIRTMKNPRKTASKAKVYEITVDKLTTRRRGYPYKCSQFETFRLTSNHNLYVYDSKGRVKKQQVKDITPGTRLVSHRITLQGRSGREEMVLDRGVFRPVHRIMAEKLLGRELSSSEEVHHIDGNHFNNTYENLEVYEACYHKSLHMSEENYRRAQYKELYYSGSANPNAYTHTLDDLIDIGASLIQKHGKLSRDLWLQQEGLPRKTAMEQRFGGFRDFVLLCEERCAEWRQPNHTVVSVSFCGYEDVYNGTVDEVHNYFVCDKSPRDGSKVTGILSANCGEQPLPPNGSCLLGSINVAMFVLDPFTEFACFDWDKYEKVIRIFTRMLDNVVELNGLPLPEQCHEIEYKRRHGMGFLGLGSCFSLLGIKYGSKEAIEMTNDILRMMAVVGFEEGISLAREKGCAPIFNDSTNGVDNKILWADSKYMQRIWEEAPDLKVQALQYGCRFTHHTSLAPTGTLALSVNNNVSNGIEPTFAHKYTRNVIIEGKKSKKAVDVYSYELLLYKSVTGSDEVPESFSTADTVTTYQHVDIQAAAQYWCDSSISKTINVPSDIPFDEFKDVYLYAYEKGLKGCTTFRFNPEAFQGVLVKQDDLQATVYEFVLDDGNVIKANGDDIIVYDGEEHTAANLYDALKEGYYGKF